MAWNLSIYLDRYVACDSISTSIEIPARTLRSRGAGAIALGAAAIAARQRRAPRTMRPLRFVQPENALTLSAPNHSGADAPFAGIPSRSA